MRVKNTHEYQTVKLLVKHGANVNAPSASRSYHGQWDPKLTPLTAAALADNLGIVR